MTAVIGLTGSIGMGKSTTAALFAAAGVPVFDADAAVHALQAPGGAALAPIAERFAGVVQNGRLDRDKLGRAVFADPAALRDLEAIMHPLVAEQRAAFLRQAQAAGAAYVLFDVPLLFETGGHKGCDAVIVCTAPVAVQRARVLARPGMTAEKFDDILARQVPDADKRAAADYRIETSGGVDDARRQVAAIIRELDQCYASA